MNKHELINYWLDTSDRDYVTMHNLFKAGDHHWSLFIGHLVLEKLLKACYVKATGENAPRIHDLLRIAKAAQIKVSEKMADSLDLITTFNISARYPDFQQSFYKKCTHDFTAENISKIEEVRIWLKNVLQNLP
jgi:HEPN domain-containing protein